MKNKSPKKDQSPTSHTPGPWNVMKDHGTYIESAHGPFKDKTIAMTIFNRNTLPVNNREEAEANAHLISAGPDLLAFAVDFLDFIDDPNMEMSELKKRAKAAILKAEGRE